MIKKASIRVSAIMFVLLLVFSSAVMMVSAAGSVIFDDAAGYFTNPEKNSEVHQKLDEAAEKTGWNMVFYSIDKGYTGEDLQNYADNYLNSNGLSDNALLYIYDVKSKKSKILTAGEVDKYFDKTNRLDDMVDELEPYTQNGDIAGAVMKCADEAIAVYEKGKPVLILESLKRYGIFAGIAGVAVGLIMFFVIKSKYKNMGKSGTYDLAANSTANLDEVEDTFVTQHTTVRTIQKDNDSSSSGGSTSSGHASRDF